MSWTSSRVVSWSCWARMSRSTSSPSVRASAMSRTASAPLARDSQSCQGSTMKSLRSTGRGTASLMRRMNERWPAKKRSSVRHEIALAPAAWYCLAMSSGLNESPAYSGRMSPAEGLFRFTSAMMEVLLGLAGLTARKKFRGGSSWATSASSSDRGVCVLARATSSCLCWRMSASVRGGGDGVGGVGSGTWAIVGLVMAAWGAAGVRAASLGAGVSDAAHRAAETAKDAADQASAATGLDVVTLASFALSVAILIGLWFGKVLRPGALGKNGLRKVDSQPWWVWLLCGFMIFYCGQVGGILVATAPALTGPGPLLGGDPTPRYQGVLQIAVYCTSLLAAAVLLRLLRPVASQAGLVRTGKSLGVGALGLLLVLPV